jgi:soluble lytic murein transglycosylase-like protein
MSWKILTIVLGFAGIAATAVPAEAQLYSWRDDAGRFVVSDRKLEATAQTFAIRGANRFRSTRPVVASRAAQFESLIAEHAAANNVNPDLVRAVIQAESAFNPRARSHKGAMGLMQLMPATAAELGVTNAYDPEQNIRGGVRYLAQLLARFDWNVELALAAYNAGPTAVDRYGAVPPYRETREYVRKIGQTTAGDAPAAATPATRLYKLVEMVDGREVTRYSNVPTAGAAPVTAR